MSTSNKMLWLLTLCLTYLLLSGVESKGMDCERHCRLHRVSVGNCRCRSDLFVKKSAQSESIDGNRDILLRELLRDYILQNEDTEDK